MSGAHRLVVGEMSKDSKGEAYLKEVGEAFSPENLEKEGCDCEDDK